LHNRVKKEDRNARRGRSVADKVTEIVPLPRFCILGDMALCGVDMWYKEWSVIGDGAFAAKYRDTSKSTFLQIVSAIRHAVTAEWPRAVRFLVATLAIDKHRSILLEDAIACCSEKRTAYGVSTMSEII